MAKFRLHKNKSPCLKIGNETYIGRVVEEKVQPRRGTSRDLSGIASPLIIESRYFFETFEGKRIPLYNSGTNRVRTNKVGLVAGLTKCDSMGQL